MSSKSKKAQSKSSSSAKEEENPFPILSQFSEVSSQDVSLSQDYVASSPPRINRDEDEEAMQVTTATTTPRSEFQAFANSILTPLMMNDEEMNLNTLPNTAEASVNLANSASVEVSPLVPSSQLLDQAGMRNQQLTSANLSAIPTSRDWHNVSGGANSRGVVSGAHFASMFASPGKDVEGEDTGYSSRHLPHQGEPRSDSGDILFGDSLGYGTNIKSSYSSRPKASHPNSYYYDTDGKSPSGSLMELVLADNVLSSGGGANSQLQSNQRALADRLKHRGIAGSPSQGPSFSDDEEQFPAPPSLMGSKSPKIGTAKSRRGGGLTGSVGSSTGSLGGGRKEKKTPGSGRKEAKGGKKAALNTSLGSNSSSVSSTTSSQQNDAENILFAMRGSGSRSQEEWQGSLYGSVESLPDVSERPEPGSAGGRASASASAKKESAKKRNKKNRDAGGFSGMDVISMIASEELQSNPSPPMSLGGKRKQVADTGAVGGLQLVDSGDGGSLFAQVMKGGGRGGGRADGQEDAADGQSSSSVFGSPAPSRSLVGLGGQGLTPPASASGSAATDGVVCNCKKSRCLKLYCDCFRLVKYCHSHCNCVDCANNLARDAERKQAMFLIKERNPDAFKPKAVAVVQANEGEGANAEGEGDKTTTSPGGTVTVVPRQTPGAEDKPAFHLSGCHCKKSACLKKYCECFSINVQCSEKCRCVDCKNISSEVRMRRLAAMESHYTAGADGGVPIPPGALSSTGTHAQMQLPAATPG